jgi:hypothetical protein
MWITVQVIDACSIDQRSTALDSVNFIAFLQQEFRQVGAILSGDTGYECCLSQCFTTGALSHGNAHLVLIDTEKFHFENQR